MAEKLGQITHACPLAEIFVQVVTERVRNSIKCCSNCSPIARYDSFARVLEMSGAEGSFYRCGTP